MFSGLLICFLIASCGEEKAAEGEEKAAEVEDEKSYRDSVYWEELKMRAEAGDAKSQYEFGYGYYGGDELDFDRALGRYKGPTQDYSEAVKWWRKAAEQGYATAQNALATAYVNGKGIPEDYNEAVNWWRKAAEQGNASALVNLGRAYYKGVGVPENIVKAYMFTNLGYAQDSGESRTKKTWLSLKEEIKSFMTNEQIAEGQKLTREWLERDTK
ncbi:sel1 repeat family protein [Akkermansiaceae bacterium]|nr:sel1 repeat family protein [Akkermansiaceae bacterium]